MDKNLLRILMVLCLVSMAGYSKGDTLPRNNFDGSQTLRGHVPKDVASSKIHHHANANELLELRIMVPLANQAELDNTVKGLYDPASPNYHHFLSPDQFNNQFKASDTELNKIKNYLISKGFSIDQQASNGSVLYVTGSVRAVEHTFGLHINHYIKKDGTMFFAPDADPTISVEIVGKVSAVAGLDNATHFNPHLNQVSQNQLSPKLIDTHVLSTLMGTGPGGYLAPGDVQKAYNLNTIPLINDASSLQNVALFELDGYLQSDIASYEAYFHLPNNNSVMLQNVLIDGYNGLPTYTGGNDEVTLDIEELIGIAPWSINKLYVYEAANTWQGWMDEWTKIANDNTAKVISCSWGIAEYESPVVSFDNQIFQRMAAQGQEVFVASGDCGAYADCSTKTLSADEPSAQPFVTGVGISALTMNSDGSYKSETASLYGGGGVSMYNVIPSYQQAIAGLATSASKVSKTMRNVPDVALTADASTAYAFYITTAPGSSGWYGFWGSSIAAPTWAAFMAQVNQGRVHTGQAIIGFLNPVIYPMAANSSQYSTDFYDISTGNNQYYPAGIGFDDATGLGSFNGANLYNDLVGSPNVVPSAPTGLSAVSGTNKVVLTWSLSIGATSYNVKRATVSGGPYQNVNSAPIVGTTFTDATVSAGSVYYYVVSAVNVTGQSPNSSQVSAVPVPVVPIEPTGLQAIPGNNQVTFSWAASIGATSYNVKRSTVSEGPWTTLLSGTTKTGYVDISAINGMTYYYTVSAVNLGGESPNINQFLVTLTPSAPLGVVATPGNNQVILSWMASTGAVSYNVKRSATSAGPYTTISTSGAVTVVNYTDNTAVNGKAYFYVVSPVNAGGEGANSLQVTATPVLSVPAAPAGLTGVSGNKQVVLSWKASTGATSYHVLRSTVSNASFTTIATVTTTNYTDSTVSNGGIYYYEVNAVNANGQGPNTSEIFVIPAGLPLPPTTITATAGNALATVTFSGASANGSVITSYTVTSSPGGKTATGSSSPITVSGLINGTAYTFTVTVTNGVGTGSASALSNTVVPFVPAPPAPTGLQGAPGNNQVTLSWNASIGAIAYNVKKATAVNGPFVILKSAVTTTGYVDTLVQNGTSYFYVVTALNASGSESLNSNQIMVVPLAPLPAPTGLSAVAGPGSVTLSWNPVPGEEFYYLGRSTVNGGPYNIITSPSVNSFKDTTIVNGVTYYYAVEAYVMVNGTGEMSPFSAQVKATPLAPPTPVTPTGLSATPGVNLVKLAWNVSSGATSYNVLRLSNWNVGYVTIVKGLTVPSYTDNSSLIDGATYYYEVIAVNTGGNSLPSNYVNVVATKTGNYTYPVYVYGSGHVQYSYLSNGKTISGTFSYSSLITVPAMTQVTMISMPNSGHKLLEEYIPYNNIGYTTNSTVTYNVTSYSYADVVFQ